jgi:ferredoxin/protein involved in ribonucleotide reduction
VPRRNSDFAKVLIKMKIQQIYTLFYSATGNTEKIVNALTEHIAGEWKVPVQRVNIASLREREKKRFFQSDTLVIVGTPVYAGRIPNKMLPYFQTMLEGNGSLAVSVVTFGNRAYDNALIELKNELGKRGLHTVAGMAMPSEHAFSDKLATGRPDESDLSLIQCFAKEVMEKIEALQEPSKGQISMPGDEVIKGYYIPFGIDGKPAVFLKAKPKTDMDLCIHCEICSEVCPMGSISRQEPDKVEGICVKCQACIKKCPVGAKYFDDSAFLSHVKMLEENYTRRIEAKCFI